MKVTASLFALAGLAAAAQGQGVIKFQVSPAGAETWVSNIPFPQTGFSYDVRATVSYTGTAQPIGLASMFFQPTVSNWSLQDSLGSFVSGGSGGNVTTPPGVVDDDAGLYGRIRPWGNTPLSTSSFLRGHIHTNPAPGFVGTYLRIAQNQLTQWVGAAGNTTGTRGIPIDQLNDVGRTTNDPAFNTNVQDIVIFKYRIVWGTSSPIPPMVFDAPAAGIGNRSTITGNGQIYWFATSTEATGQIRGDVTVITASIGIPTPASLALLGLGGLAISVRRRDRPLSSGRRPGSE